MGSLKKRWKRGSLWLAILAVFAFSVVVSGCAGASSSQEQNTKEQTEEQKKGKKDQDKENEQKKAEKREIPQGLLPGQAEEEGIDAESSEGTGEENSAVYADKSSDGKGSQGGNQAASGNGGSVSGGTSSSGNGSQKHTISIRFSVDSSSADGSVSYGSGMTLSEGATVYDALAATGLSYTGYGYIEEIGGLWEKDFSAKSGWKYYVNGSAPMLSCVDYVLEDGDSVQWVYVLNP